MKSIQTIAKTVTKIAEIVHWVAVALMTAATVCSAVKPSWVDYFVSFDAKECCGAELSVYGFEILAPVTDGKPDMTAFLLFGIGATLILALMALIFRNLHRIIKRAEGSTPFQTDTVRCFRMIGIFAIAVPAVGTIISTVARLVLGTEVAEVSSNLGGLVIGIVVLCMAEFLIRGVALEQDMDGLV